MQQRAETTTLFISYSRRDKEPWLDLLLDHLAPLENEKLVQIWNDQAIEAGASEPWEEQLLPKLQAAGVLILLLSPAFARSKYIQSKELPFALEQKRSGRALVYLVHLKPYAMEEWLTEFQILPSKDDSIEEAKNPNVALRAVAQQIRSDLQKRKAEPVEKVPAPKPATAPAKAEAAPLVIAPGALEIRTHPKDGLSYVFIPPGRFRMGASEGDGEAIDREKPAHDVHITNGFWMGQTPVTVEAYKRFIKATGAAMPTAPGYDKGWKEDSLPMTMVSWDDAQGYCQWAGLRLPTEAEWEYAARAGTTGSRYGELDKIAWYASNTGDRPCPMRGKESNAFQLYDMLGNVWEWVSDWYGDYETGAAADPKGAPKGEYRVLRGGSWCDDPGLARASFRGNVQPDGRNGDFGFRCSGEKLVP